LAPPKSCAPPSEDYADDLVILCRRAKWSLQRLRKMIGKLKLTINEEKTSVALQAE
jgi:hypothetical protein